MPGLSRYFFHTAAALLLTAWFPLPADADEIWTIVAKESHFGPGVNTLVLKRRNRTAVEQAEIANAATSGRFLVISKGSVYLAVDEQSSSPQSAITTTDTARWPHKKLIQIGEHIFRDYCFPCRDVIREDPITLKFSSTTMDPRLAITATDVLTTQ
jgi:hypothetical protein